MRKLIGFGMIVLAGSCGAQVWEKRVAPGLTYRMEVDLAAPRLIHALRWSPSTPETQAVPELSKGRVYSENVAESRDTVSAMVARTEAVGGINADFFPWTGDPLGLMVRSDEVLSRPYPNRAVFAWGPNGSTVAIADWGGKLRFGQGRTLTLSGVNQECGDNELMANNALAGYARAKSNAAMAVAKVVEGGFRSTEPTKLEIQYFLPEGTSTPIQEGNVILVATGSRKSDLRLLQPGDTATLDLTITGVDWDRYDHAVGGGPFLVRNGLVAVDADRQGFNKDFADKRHPRTAVGRTASGEIWWVAIDGRQSMSVGATLQETAAVLLKLGCLDAVNLDGGGSTTFNLFGLTLNRPSDGRERPVANGVIFKSTRPAANGETFAILGPQTLAVGDVKTFTLSSQNGEVPNADVLWSAQGEGWIDQGGTFRASAPGTATVRAYSKGQITSLQIQIESRAKGRG
jgi:hypothetical protein